MSFAGASKHVKVLEQAGLIERTVEGRQHRCRLRGATLEPASAWLRHYERYWTDGLDALEDLIARHGRPLTSVKRHHGRMLQPVLTGEHPRRAYRRQRTDRPWQAVRARRLPPAMRVAERKTAVARIATD